MQEKGRMYRLSVFIIILFVFFSSALHAFAQEIVIDDSEKHLIGKSVTYLEDTGPSMSISEVVNNKNFQLSNKDVVNLGLSNSFFWIKFTVLNKGKELLILNVDQPALNIVALYQPDSTGRYEETNALGNNYSFGKRYITNPSYLLPLNASKDVPTTFYLKIKGNTPLVIPIFISKQEVIRESLRQKNILFGIYVGIIICMLLYNLFLLFSIRDDKSYFWYVMHTLFVGLTQASIFGYTFEYLWPENTWLARESVFLFTCLVSVVGIIFMQVFLNTRKVIPRVNKIFYIFFALYAIILYLSLKGDFIRSYQILQPTQGFVALFILAVSFRLVRQGHKQARFYLISWFLFMVGIIIFALKDFNVVPYNNFTSTIMLSGSAVQVILLSFALGDKINILQASTIQATLENERIVREQNVILEKKVDERTIELKESNDGLNKAMKELKDAEIHLVESEKMASLGQLTAGIAHEINNPINFVTSNVKPLKRDVQILLEIVDTMEQVMIADIPLEEKKKQIEEYKADLDYDYLKEEIDHLLKGIGEGASRTAEIVKGLRIFSRLDEDDLKKADINEGLDSTLVITNNLLNNVIEIKKNYGNIPLVECYPGKLNQVFLNIISNGLYAINKRFGTDPGGVMLITTSNNEENVQVSLRDNGTGMDENTKKKLFEPFFTTKEVGEGTGLGLSIVYNTIIKHNGQIEVNSVLGEGTEFLITLPIIHK